MRKIGFILFLTFSLSQTVQISVDRNRIEEGELIQFSIEVTGGKDFAKVDMKKVQKDFEIVSGPGQQTNIQWINGSMTSTKTLTWTLSPKRLGTLTVPAISGTVDGKSFQGKPIQIQVKKSTETSDNSVFIVADIDKEKAYLGEQITVTYKLYKNANISIEPFQMPEFPGFWVENLYTPQRVQYRNSISKCDHSRCKISSSQFRPKGIIPYPSRNTCYPIFKSKSSN